MTEHPVEITARKIGTVFRIPLELIDDTAARPMTDQEYAARRSQREAEKAYALAAANAEWHLLFQEYAAVPAVRAVLELHRPEGNLYDIVCTHQISSGWESDAELWPCPTYTAVRDAERTTS